MLKGLIENECAGQNPLVKLGSHFNSANLSEQQQKLHQVAQQQAANALNAESLLNEYLSGPNGASGGAGVGVVGGGLIRHRATAPRSFHMGTLFNELKQIDNAASSIIKPQPLTTNTSDQQTTWSSNTSTANDWSQAYLAAFQKQQQQQQQQQQVQLPVAAAANFAATVVAADDRSLKWSSDYLTQSEATIFDDAWEDMLLKNAVQNPLAAGLSDNIIAANQLNEEMRKTANELLDSMQDSRFSETEFLEFVRELSVNAMANTEKQARNDDQTKQIGKAATAKNETDVESQDEASATRLAAAFDLEASDLAQEWVKEFESSSNLEERANLNDYWKDLQSEWNTLASENPNHPWLDEFQKVFDTYKTYDFDAENPLRMHSNAFEEGLARLRAHDIVNAVLLFEAAVQAQPDNMLAWQYLGTTQIENEQDAQAIRALRRCLELKPDNLIALSAMAASYTNESMQRLAFESLLKWIKQHPVYAGLLKNDEQAERLLQASEAHKNAATSPFLMATFSVVDPGDFIDLQEIFLKAVRESTSSAPNKIDPDLQCCLGILFHLSNEYDKAADCFKTALQVKPNDHLLWNKLGATYANNNRNEEAIDAYYQALKLCPGFVRARYNLGVACINLGAYKEAVEHFLTALVQQSQACIGSKSESSEGNDTRDATKDSASSSKPIAPVQMSETIWNTLRIALSYLKRTDLHAACTTKNIELLRQEFNI